MTIVAAPTAGNNYSYAVFTNNALAYWRLNELANPATNPIAYDYNTGRNGTYGEASLNYWHNGYQVPATRPP